MGPPGVEKVSADRRFRRWCQDSVCDDDRFARLTADREPDLGTVVVDGTLVKVRRHPKRPMPSRRRMKAGPQRPLRI